MDMMKRISKGVALVFCATTMLAATGLAVSRRLAPSGVSFEPRTRGLVVPAAAGSGMYSLAASPGGTVYLSWLEAVSGSTYAFKFTTLDGDAWAPPRTIATGDDWFVNWADHPSLVPLTDGSLAAHWLVNNPGRQGAYGYGVRIARSADDGRTWREIFRTGTANLHGYSGFVSMLPLAHGFLAVYLGPPVPESEAADPEADHVMGLSVATFGTGGALLSDVVADADTCTCCSTSVVQTSRGPIAAYRDHTGETRDISIVRNRGGRWTAPSPVHPDGWRINACPTNGPVLAAAGERVALAWFTAAAGVPRVRLAFSTDGGDRFAEPLTIDGGRPVGWPGVVLLDDGSAVVSWLEATGEGRGEVRIRRVRPDGRLGDMMTVASSTSGRSTGVPQMVLRSGNLIVAWRSDRLHTAIVPIP